jgi:hypothetical protein
MNRAKAYHQRGNLSADGKTPAPNVILYVYHTDQTGIIRQHRNKQDGQSAMDASAGG